jgi:hypothetical protein
MVKAAQATLAAVQQHYQEGQNQGMRMHHRFARRTVSADYFNAARRRP